MTAPPSSRPAHLQLVPREQGLGALRPMLRAVAARTLRQGLANADVDDCVGEACRRVLEGQSRLRPGEPLAAWACGIVRHVALDLMRSRRRHAQPMSELPDAPDSRANPERLAGVRQNLERLQSALADLEDGPRRAVLGYYAEGKSYQELAEQLGVPMGTIATWVSRSRKRLSYSLLEQEGGSHD